MRINFIFNLELLVMMIISRCYLEGKFRNFCFSSRSSSDVATDLFSRGILID